jgi:hypothetical protein
MQARGLPEAESHPPWLPSWCLLAPVCSEGFLLHPHPKLELFHESLHLKAFYVGFNSDPLPPIHHHQRQHHHHSHIHHHHQSPHHNNNHHHHHHHHHNNIHHHHYHTLITITTITVIIATIIPTTTIIITTIKNLCQHCAKH